MGSLMARDRASPRHNGLSDARQTGVDPRARIEDACSSLARVFFRVWFAATSGD